MHRNRSERCSLQLLSFSVGGRKGARGLIEYQYANNRLSIDGLPALRGSRLSEDLVQTVKHSSHFFIRSSGKSSSDAVNRERPDLADLDP